MTSFAKLKIVGRVNHAVKIIFFIDVFIAVQWTGTGIAYSTWLINVKHPVSNFSSCL
ncbi:hypothetical protein D3C86_1191990 [compost metagenome]